MTRFLSSILCCLVLVTSRATTKAITTDKLGETYGMCDPDVPGAPCDQVDGYVGSVIIHEDEYVRIWNMTLLPGQSTSMHRHDHDYHFVVLQPAKLRLFGEGGIFLTDFDAQGTMGFTVDGDELKPIGATFPFPIPLVHAAKNIDNHTFMEILYEVKQPFVSQNTASEQEL